MPLKTTPTFGAGAAASAAEVSASAPSAPESGISRVFLIALRIAAALVRPRQLRGEIHGSRGGYACPVPTSGVTRGVLDRETSERFQLLRRELGVTTLGLNLIVLAPRQVGRIHRHERQEEVYLVLEGELTLIVDGGEQRLGRDEVVRVGPEVRRQLVNAGPDRLVVLALGGAVEHEGRDGIAWSSWEDDGPGGPPQEVPAPPDLPA